MNKAAWLARINAIKLELDEHFLNGSSPTENAGCRMRVIDLASTWERAVREIILFYAARDRFGLSRPRRTHKNAVIASHLSATGASREINWQIPTQVISVSLRLGIPEHGVVLGVLGKKMPWILDDLRHYRNFVAHGSEESALKLTANCSPVSAPQLKPYPFELFLGVPRFRHWEAEMKNIFRALPN
jgi:hypothetical protein